MFCSMLVCSILCIGIFLSVQGYSHGKESQLPKLIDQMLARSSCPDPSHCMSKWGYCGTGPDYCGDGCQGGPCNGNGANNGGNGAARTFRINNQCSQKVWMGVQGEPLILNGGFELDARSSIDISVPDRWISGRLWARTGCQWINNKLKCAIGDCGTPSNGFGVGCKGIGGQPPATLAEFTLAGWGGSDFYDLSNVDGHTIGMTIRPIPGQYTVVNNPSLGKYNCGTATCTFDINRCPPELQMDDQTGGKVCASICAAIHNAQQRAKFAYLQNIYNNPDTRSLVCCSCDGNHCVSPYDNKTPGGKCYVEQWPRSTQNTRYDEVFKSQCPDAYSWQFDDHASTYQCSKANYEIILCPSGQNKRAKLFNPYLKRLFQMMDE